MKPYAVIETGGKQYLVHDGDRLDIEKIEAEPGQTVAISNVLAVSDGTRLTVGTPKVSHAEVTLEVLSHGRHRKVISYKKKRRKGYHRKVGHRQAFTRVRVIAVRCN
jgi:large subunit ribosomal protein L21